MIKKHMRFSSRILRPVVGLILVILANPLIADEAAEKAVREKLEQELEAAEEDSAEKRIDVMSIDVIRQFGHEIRFDEPLVNISLGHSNDAAGDRHNYTFVKFGLALLEGGLFFDDLRYFALPKNARVTISDAGMSVSINGKPTTAAKLPDSTREDLVLSEGDRAIIESGLEVEVVSSVEYGFSEERFGNGRWVGAFGIVPVRIWDGGIHRQKAFGVREGTGEGKPHPPRSSRGDRL